MKRLVGLLLVLVFVLTLAPISAQAADVSAYAPILDDKIQEAQDPGWVGTGYLFDMNRDGVQELVMVYRGAFEMLYSIYTIRDGSAVAVCKDERLYGLAGGSGGCIAVTDRGGGDYRIETLTSYTVWMSDQGDEIETMGEWVFYSFDGTRLNREWYSEYDRYTVNGMTDVNRSSATINGEPARLYGKYDAAMESRNILASASGYIFEDSDYSINSYYLSDLRAMIPNSKPVDGNPFRDVKPGAYYYDAVLWAVNHNPQITNGTSKTAFSPAATCTRGQVVTFLWRAAGCPEPMSTKNPFKDVKKDAYYYKAVLWAVEQGITNGTSKKAFSPNAGCTRGQVVTLLYRANGEPKVSAKNPFKDVKSGAYYYDAVLWAVKNEITNGTSKTAFSPNATCTRGQIVTFLYRAQNLAVSEWSEWSTTKPTGSNLEVQTKTRYRFRDQQYMESPSKLDGWQLSHITYPLVNNEPWSEWQTTYVDATDTREVETRTKTVASEYYLAHYCDPNYGPGWVGNWDGTSDDLIANYHTYGWASVGSLTAWGHCSDPDQDWYSAGASCPCGFDQWYPFDVHYTEVTEYRFRQRIPTYHLIRWVDNWSDWSDTSVSATDTRQVETQTLYRYRTI